MTMISEEKIVNWLAVKSDVNVKMFPEREELTQLRLQKLLYFLQGTYLSLYNEKLFDDKFVHKEYGPVAENSHAKYIGKRNINSLINWEQAIKDFSELNSLPKVNSVLNSVFNKYADVSTSKLVDITHQQKPWNSVKQDEEITPEILKEFFDSIVVRVNE